jgi:prevent-host-death family protein
MRFMPRTTVGIDEAKNRLSELLDRVEAGEVIGLSRRGKQIALLIPVNQERPSARQAIARIRQLRKGTNLGGSSIKELKNEGRR